MQERRSAVRYAPGPDEPLARVRLRAGRELTVVNISSNGVLAEGDARLLPGMHLDIHVMTAEGRLLVRSRVARAYVFAFTCDTVTYRGALIFERAITVTAGYDLPGTSPPAPVVEGIAYPDRAA